MSKCTFPACPCRATGQYCNDKPVKKARKAIPRRSAKGILKAEQKKTLVNTDMLFYIEEIWMVRSHVCQCGCKQSLGNQPLIYHFHHILPKRLYPQFRHEAWNILLVSWNCHTSWERNPDTRPSITAITIQTYLKHVDDSNPHITLKEILRS